MEKGLVCLECGYIQDWALEGSTEIDSVSSLIMMLRGK